MKKTEKVVESKDTCKVSVTGKGRGRGRGRGRGKGKGKSTKGKKGKKGQKGFAFSGKGFDEDNVDNE